MSVLREIAPVLIVGILKRDPGQTAAEIQREIAKSLFPVNPDFKFEPSFLYPLMKSMTKEGVLKRDEKTKKYSLNKTEKNVSRIDNDLKSLKHLFAGLGSGSFL
jgi:DNA-binding PadR family transcriptional regulator